METVELVSIILPTYNRGNRLAECIQSVIDQTYEHWELILCDDCSTDDTETIGKSWANRDKRIRYFRNATNKGLPANRNVGISIAKGSMILFIEDDIELEPDCLAVLVETYRQKAERDSIGAVAPSIPLVGEFESKREKDVLDFAWRAQNQKMNHPCTLNPLTGVVRQNFSPEFHGVWDVPNVHACSLYSRQALESVGGYDETTYQGNYLYEETDLNVRIRKLGYTLIFQPKAIMNHYHGRGDGGCRVGAFRYGVFFVLNHLKFLVKNYAIRSVWMMPFFCVSTGYVALMAIIGYRKYVQSQRSS
jgi:glycosyltransferase involved in cell wall biosynthesis